MLPLDKLKDLKWQEYFFYLFWFLTVVFNQFVNLIMSWCPGQQMSLEVAVTQYGPLLLILCIIAIAAIFSYS